VIIVEFTESGAETFAEVVDRLVASLSITQEGGPSRPPPPSVLEMSITGQTNYRTTLLGIQIQPIATTTSFAFPFNPGTGEPPTVEQAREMLGDDPEIEFVEIQGFVDENIGLTGDDLEVAYPGTHSVSQQPIVTVVFKDRGARIFGELTQQIAGSETDQIAIFLDDQQLISPRVTGVITAGTATIEGDFTIERVRDLALLLEAGRLPLPIELIQERSVDAILGADSLRKSLIAGIVGLSLVLAFMVLYYRLPGVIAATALFIYAALVLATLKILPGSFTTLNLSGVAALILSIGMAVDANILIFERMKDELRGGRTLLSAINIGFNRAWPAIRDGNVSTLITCGVLFWFSEQLGETVLQGFAVTLAIGVAWSMFSAITVSRTLLRVMASTGASRRLGLFLPVGEIRTSREPRAEGGRR
jgi:preprotein translocase subunit SecD